MDVQQLPERMELEEWLKTKGLWITITFFGEMSESLRRKGHSVEEWLDATVRTQFRGNQLPDARTLIVHALGGRIWKDDPYRIMKVTDYKVGLDETIPHLRFLWT